jgi:hypothetical protein
MPSGKHSQFAIENGHLSHHYPLKMGIFPSIHWIFPLKIVIYPLKMLDLSLPLDAPWCPRYPNTHVVFTARCDVAPAQGTGQRAMMAQA